MRVMKVVYLESQNDIFKVLDNRLITIPALNNTVTMNLFRSSRIMKDGLFIVKKEDNIRHLEEPPNIINFAVYYASLEILSINKIRISFHLKNIVIFLLLFLICLFFFIGLIIDDPFEGFMIKIVGGSIPAFILFFLIINSFFVKKSITYKLEKILNSVIVKS